MGSEVSTETDTTDGSAVDLDSQRPTQTTPDHLVCLSRAHNKFSVEIYQEYAKEGKRPGNFVLAPIGVSLALGLLHLGAKGPTQQEIHKVLHLNEMASDQLLPAFAAMHWDVLRSTFPKGCVFEVALRLFAQSPIYVASYYGDICMTYELSRLKQADFKNRPDKARLEINQWADETTRSRVRDVIPMGIIDRDTKLLGLSSIYMKSIWLHPFDPKKIVDESFHLAMKETLNVRMMVQHRLYRYVHFQKLDCEAVELPFANRFTRVLVLLPKKQDGVGKVEHKLDRKMLESIYEALQEEYIEVHFPKFRYELGLPLGEMLQKLGMKTPFCAGKADFSNMNGAQDLFVSKIFHHVCLEFDEGIPNGSGSHKSTPNDGGQTSQEAERKIFRCDHPFLFIVKDSRTGAILFLGRVVRPLLAT